MYSHTLTIHHLHITYGKPVDQAVELLVEGRVLRTELGACDEALSEAHERGLSEAAGASRQS